MKVSAAALFALGLAGTALAQAGDGLPACAQKCADKFLQGGIGNCGQDPKCICSNSTFLDEIACCLTDSCADKEELERAKKFAKTLCGAFDVQVPDEVVCKTVSAVPSASTTATSAATTSGATVATTATSSAATSATEASSSTSASANLGPHPTAAAVGLGAIGGVMAAIALL